MHARSRRVRAASLGLAAGLVATTSLGAQLPQRDAGRHGRYLALNVAIGATVSAAHAIASGAPLRSALTRGLLGGSLMSAGMELVGTESRRTRFAGLQVTAVGASVTRAASSRAPMLSDVTLPIYPFYVRVRPGSAAPVTARLSLASTARLVSIAAGGRRPDVDWGETLVTGAPVLRSPRWRMPSPSCPPPCEGAFAQHGAGVIVYSASAGTDYDLSRTLAHESLHLAQQTRDVLLNAVPASDALLGNLGPAGRTISRWFVADFLLPFRFIDEGEVRMRGAPRRDSWYETEARAYAPGGQLR